MKIKDLNLFPINAPQFIEESKENKKCRMLTFYFDGYGEEEPILVEIKSEKQYGREDLNFIFKHPKKLKIMDKNE